MLLLRGLLAALVLTAVGGRVMAEPSLPPTNGDCLPAEGQPTANEARLTRLLDQIDAAFPGPDPLLAAMKARETTLCLDGRPMDALGYFAPERNALILNAALSDGALFVIAVHELRHLDQVRHGFCPSVALERGEYLRLSFAMEADAQATATLYAWQAHLDGLEGPWAGLAGLSTYADVAAAFEAAIAGGVDQAMTAGFGAWYGNPKRLETYYTATCGAYYDALDRSNLLPGNDRLDADFLERLCRLPDGAAYPCAPP